MKTRAAAIVAPLILGLILSGCGQGEKPAADGDRFAGLDGEILKWRADILKSDFLCQTPDQKCVGFEVSCKAERVITAEEKAKGVTARLVAAIDWTGWDPKLKQSQMASATAEFTRTSGAWTRTAHKPVNMSTCADQ